MALRDIFIIMLINLVWGLNFVALKFSLVDFDPMFANAVRFMMVGVFFLPWLKIIKGQMKLLLLTSLVMGVLHFGALMIAIQIADDVSPIAIAAQLGVPFATLMAVIVLKESVGWKRAAAIACSFIGVMVMGFDPIVFDYVLGLVVMAIAAFFYALATILLRQLKAVSAMTTQAWIAIAGLIGSAALSMVFETGQMASVDSASNSAWLALIYSALLSSVVGHGCYNYLLTKYEVAVVSPFTLLTPVVGVVGSILILDETLSTRLIIGASLTLFGVFIIAIRNKKRRTPVSASAVDGA